MILYDFIPPEEFQQPKLILYIKREIAVENLTSAEFAFMSEFLKGQTVLIKTLIKNGFKFQEQRISITNSNVKPFIRREISSSEFAKEYECTFPPFSGTFTSNRPY